MKKPEHSVRVVSTVMSLEGLSPYGKLTLCKVMQLSILGWCRYSDENMGSMLSCSPKTINRSIVELEKRGFITVKYEERLGRAICPLMTEISDKPECDHFFYVKESELESELEVSEVLIVNSIKAMNKRPKGCFIGNKGLADALGMNEAVVCHKITKLVRLGYLIRTGSKFHRKLDIGQRKIERNTKTADAISKDKKCHYKRQEIPHIKNTINNNYKELFLDKSKKAFLAKRRDNFLRNIDRLNPVKKLILKLKHPVKKNDPAPAQEIKFAKRLETKPYQRSLLPEEQVNPGVPTKLKRFDRDVFNAAQLYKRLVEIGCVQHKIDSKAYAYSINMLKELISVRSKNPYSNIQGQKRYADLLNKKFTVDEVFDIFAHAFCDPKSENKIKSAGTFIMCRPKGAPAFSPFFSEYTSIVESEKRSVQLTKEAESLKRAFDKMYIKNIDNRGFNRLSTMVLSTTEGFIVAPALRHIHYDDKVSVFCSYVSEKIQRINFKVGYLFGEIFMNQFVEDMRKTGVLIRGTAQSVHNQMYGGI